MMETVTLLLFSLTLITCVATGTSVLYALLIGYVIFCVYARLKKYTAIQILKMSAQGIITIKNILIIFLLIGMLTALWRAGGTIPTIVCCAAKLISPPIFLLAAFLLNCIVSFLTGTAFGTAATMGAICMTMALALQLDPVLVGGAVLSGAYFGDRCSPVSTSALLVAELTKTNIYKNIVLMIITAAVPFGAACLIYTVIGYMTFRYTGSQFDVQKIFAEEFNLGAITLIPAGIILILSMFRINVKKTMTASIICSILVCILYQKLQLKEIIELMMTGYQSPNPEAAAMINGGGIISMIKVAAIVCLSSSYAGIFKATGLLNQLKTAISRFGTKYSAYAVTLAASVITSMIACNQTLTIMLTQQLCDTVEQKKEQLAIDLENSAVIIAPLIPWSIAGGAPLASMGAPIGSLLAACYLYFVPLWNLLRRNHHKTAKNR